MSNAKPLRLKVIRAIRIGFLCSLAASLVYAYYTMTQTRKEIESWLEKDVRFDADQVGLSFKVEDLEQESTFLSSDGNFRLQLQDVCFNQQLDLGEVEYSVSHLPWQVGAYEVRFAPNEQIFRFPSIDSGDPYVFNGKVSPHGVIQANLDLPEFRFYRQDMSVWLYSQGYSKVELTAHPEQGRFEGNAKFDSLTFGTDAQVEVRHADAVFKLKDKGTSSLAVVAQKIRGESIFIDKPGASLEVMDMGKQGRNLKIKAKSDESSVHGVYSKSARLQAQAQVENWLSMEKVSALAYTTCGGRIADEESRLRIRLAINDLVSNGLSLDLQEAYIDSEQGEVKMEAAVGLKSLNKDRYLVDLHDSFRAQGKLSLPKGFFHPDWILPAMQSGALFENSSGQLLSTFEYRDRSLLVNSSTIPAQASLGFYEVFRPAKVALAFDNLAQSVSSGINPVHEFMKPFMQTEQALKSTTLRQVSAREAERSKATLKRFLLPSDSRQGGDKAGKQSGALASKSGAQAKEPEVFKGLVGDAAFTIEVPAD